MLIGDGVHAVPPYKISQKSVYSIDYSPILVLMGTEGFHRVEYKTGMDAVQSETVVAELEK